MNKITSHQLHEKLSDLKLVWRELWVAILVYNRIRYDAPTRIKYIQTFVHKI